MNELAANNPCIKFIVDNYDMLCRAHPGVLKKFISKKIRFSFGTVNFLS